MEGFFIFPVTPLFNKNIFKATCHRKIGIPSIPSPLRAYYSHYIHISNYKLLELVKKSVEIELHTNFSLLLTTVSEV